MTLLKSAALLLCTLALYPLVQGLVSAWLHERRSESRQFSRTQNLWKDWT